MQRDVKYALHLSARERWVKHSPHIPRLFSRERTVSHFGKSVVSLVRWIAPTPHLDRCSTKFMKQLPELQTRHVGRNSTQALDVTLGIPFHPAIDAPCATAPKPDWQ